MLRLALSSQKYCGITPYYGSPTYHYLCMGMSVSPQIWQQFVDLVFQDDLIKHKQNFDVTMDDMFIHSTAEEHMGDLMDLFKVLRKYGLKISPQQFRGHGHGRANYQNSNGMYQYQYYTHDPQPEQYGPSCSLCSGFNHSPKHCYKGEHDISNIMEK